MPSTTRRRLLASVGGLVALAGCSGAWGTSGTETSARTTETTRRTTGRKTHRPQTDRPGWVGLEVENNHATAHEVRVEVASDDEQLFARTLALRPQSEPEFNSVVPIPESGGRPVGVDAELSNGRSASATFTVAADAEYQRLFVTIDADGVLQLTQGTEPAEPIPTTDGG